MRLSTEKHRKPGPKSGRAVPPLGKFGVFDALRFDFCDDIETTLSALVLFDDEPSDVLNAFLGFIRPADWGHLFAGS
jgi:hypothetical protein